MPILFDLDDTLLDTAHARSVYLGHLYANHRAELPCDEAGFRAAWRRAGDRHFVRYLRRELSFTEFRRTMIREVFTTPDMTAARADEILHAHAAVQEDSWQLYPDVLPTLDALRGIPLGIITNGNPEQQIKKLQRVGILDRFGVVSISEAVGHAKPAPKIFRHACAQLQCEPSECVFIGDDWARDIEGAWASGMQPIWLTRSRASSAPQTVAIPSIQSLTELVERSDLRALLGLGVG